MRLVATICRELTADRRTDGELLRAFRADRCEDAFLELLRRHGPLVWGACRRLLPDPADAEDAFQAAFLVLVRQARRLSHTAAIGPWLHRVAVWTARNVRRKNARRLARQTPLPDHLPGPAPDADLKADLDAALLALPARLRESIILCHLHGFTRREAAERLGCPEGTLSAWLSRGLARLRSQLRGLDPTTALGGAAVAVPAALAANTTRAAVASSIAGGVVPPAVSSIVEGVLHMFWVKKATAASAALFAVFALGVGVGLGTRTEYVAAIAGDGQEKLAPAPTKEVVQTGAPTTDEIAELEAKIRATSVAHQTALAGAKAAQDRLAFIKKLQGDPKDIEEATVTLARFQANVDLAATELELLKAKLAALKAAKLKADDKPAKPEAAKQLTALNNLFGSPVELEQQLREAQIEAEKARVLAAVAEAQAQFAGQKGDPATVQAAKAAAAKAKADADLAMKQIEVLRLRLPAAKAVNAPQLKAVGACIEVVVIGGGEPWPCRVREYGREGKFIGSVIAEDGKALELIMARAMKDPGGPRDLWLTVSADQAPSAVVQAAEACKKAGFTTVSVNGTLPKGVELPLRQN